MNTPARQHGSPGVFGSLGADDCCVFVRCWKSGTGNRGQQSSSAFPPPVDSSKQCSEVQVQFVQEKIGSVSLVPDQPVHGKKDFHFRKDSPMN